MAYATATDLLDRFGAEEMAQVATPREFPRVATDLLRATVAGADRSAWTADEVAAADAAYLRIQKSLSDSDNDMNMYIGARYTLPLTPMPANLVRVACDVARYRLYEDHAPEEVRLRYKDSIHLLEMISQGKLPLGVETPQATAGAPQFKQTDRVFSRDTLEDY